MTAAEWLDTNSGWLVRAGCASHVGHYRERNEDHVYLDPDHPFALVLDGMGGHEIGERASATGAEAVASVLRAGLEAGEAPPALIERALRTGNEAVLALSQSAKEFENCGTTVVFAFLAGGAVWVPWLGDSPAFRVSGEHIEKLTRPHNVLAALVDAGRISESEASDFRGGGQLWKYLGSRELGPPCDAVSFVPRPGDVLLLATDGVSSFLPDDELLAGCRSHPDPRHCAEELVRRALDANSRDNCACAVLTFEWAGAGEPPEPRQEAWKLSAPEPPRPARAHPGPRGTWWQFWK